MNVDCQPTVVMNETQLPESVQEADPRPGCAHHLREGLAKAVFSRQVSLLIHYQRRNRNSGAYRLYLDFCVCPVLE